MKSLKMKIARKKRRGFTLIEMVIVITIIGLLSSIAVTKYSKVQKNAKLNADYATAANLATAAMMSINDDKTSVDTASLLTNKYIQFIPKSKSQEGRDFDIRVGSGGEITITSNGVIFYPKEKDLTIDKTEANK